MDFLHKLHDPQGLQELIRAFGYVLLFGIIFAETGLLVGFFLPGDSLLFVAGLMASQGHLQIAVLILLLCVAAVAGDTVGYFIGRKIGAPLFAKPDGKIFKRKHLEAAHAFYEKHGSKAIVLARFVPIVRTFAPTVAGAAGMEYKLFLTYNALGGVLWIVSMSLMGFFLGQFEVVEKNLEKAVIGIVLLSILPMILHTLKERKMAKNAAPLQGKEAGVR